MPEDLQTIRGVRLPEVLPPEELARLRRRGFSYSQVAEMIGLGSGVVAQYARVALPPELRRRRSSRERVSRRKQCQRCDLLEEEGNRVEEVEVEYDGRVVTERWCALCRLEAQGVKLLDFFESGEALEYEEMTGEAVWIV